MTEAAVRNIDPERLKELAGFRAEPVVISMYLDVDGRRHPRPSDIDPHLDRLVREARRIADARSLPADVVDTQLDRIMARVREGFDRSRVRGVAFFAGGDRFEVVEVPRPVRNHVVLNQAPAVRELEELLDEYQRFMVVLVDRRRARYFRFELGELVERTELYDPVPSRVDGTDDGGLMASHVQSHVDEEARRHFRHAADVAMRELEEWNADRVILGGPTEAVAEFEELLHSYVRECVVDRLSVSVQASDTEIRDAALDVEESVERRHEAEIVDQLKEGLGSSQRAVVGVDDTLRAVFERRVDLLIVSRAFVARGWRCGACDFLAIRGSACSVCESVMDPVDDVVGEAIELARSSGSRVETCENADLDVLGRIGALLRF